MARYQVPTANSIKIIDTAGRRAFVLVMNSGPADFFLEILQNMIDNNVDPTSGLPENGVKVATNTWPPLILPFFNGVIYARAAVPGAQVDAWQGCPDC